MNRKFIIVSLTILGVVFVATQFYGFHRTPNTRVVRPLRGKITWKLIQKEIEPQDQDDVNIEPTPIPETPTPTPEITQQVQTELPTVLPNKPISNSTWHLFDLPYPPPAKHRTEGKTLTTHIPVPDDELIATFRAKYKEYHDNMYTGRKRFIVWQKMYTWGLGNRIEGLITTILVGLLTDRAIIIDDPLIEGLVDWPWLASYKAANQKAYLLGPRYVASNDECYFWDRGFGRDYEHEDFSKKWTTDILVFECNCPGFHWITRNPLYFETLRRLGAIPPESAGVPKEDYSFYVASWISKMFFGKINPKFQSIIDGYVNSWNEQKAFVIGFQIRMGGGGDASFMTDAELERAITCAQDMAKGHTNVKYMVASDNTNAISRISNYFGQDNVIVVTGTPKHVAFQFLDDQEDMVKLLIDNWLLSEVDELIITPQSTFGAIASFRGGKLPMYVLYEQCEKALASIGPGGHWKEMLLW